MPGTDRIRTCPECGKPVYNADGLTESELFELITTSAPDTNQNLPAIYRRSDGKLMLGNSDCDLITLANRICSWPSVAVLITAFTTLTLAVRGNYHTGMQCALAGQIAMVGTILAMLLIQRYRPNLLKIKGKFPGYRFWTVCTSGGTISLWLIITALHLQIWTIPRTLLADIYSFGWLATLLIAFLITRHLSARKSHVSDVPAIPLESANEPMLKPQPPQG